MIPLSLRFAVRELRAGVRGFRIFLACLAVGVAAVAGFVPWRPDAEPRKMNAAPSPALGASYSGAPTITSPYPSPLTSPAAETLEPRLALSWSDSSRVAAVVGSEPTIPAAPPRNTKAAPSLLPPASYMGAPTTMSS